MKKFAIGIIAGIAMLSGIACGGGSNWSEADKAQLAQQKTLAISLGALTEKQAECYGDWIQNRYDSMAKAMADDGNSEAKKSLNKACKIASTSSDEEEVATTTTTMNSAKAKKISLCSESIDNITDGLDIITDGIGNAVAVGGSTAREFVATAIEFVDTSIESVQLCADLAPTEAATTLDSLMEARVSLTELEGLL